MLAAESYKDIGVSELEWEKEKEIERRGEVIYFNKSDFHYLWIPKKGFVVGNTSTSGEAELPFVGVFKEMPALWKRQYWCVHQVTHGGFGKVTAEVFKCHPAELLKIKRCV